MFFDQGFVRIGIVIGTVLILSACQTTTPVQKQKNTSQIKKTSATTLEITRRAIPVIRSKDGIQDLPWTLTQIQGRKALFFNQMPSLTLQSASQRFIGNTGCNALYGNYDIDVAKRTIQFKASAGHQSCNHSLVQEADLMDALARVQYFQIQANTIRLLDAQRQVLIQAEKK